MWRIRNIVTGLFWDGKAWSPLCKGMYEVGVVSLESNLEMVQLRDPGKIPGQFKEGDVIVANYLVKNKDMHGMIGILRAGHNREYLLADFGYTLSSRGYWYGEQWMKPIWMNHYVEDT